MSNAVAAPRTQEVRSNRSPTHEFVKHLQTVRKPIIVGHVTPDADCIGSNFGLALAMRENGIDATVGLPTGCVANKISFMLDLSRGVPTTGELNPSISFDSIIVIDTAAAKRINIQPLPDLGGPLVSFNIDHHITNDDFARHNWVDPHASSSCEMVSVLVNRLGWKMSKPVASLLYAGLYGDTGGFSLPCTSAESLRIGAELVSAGADVAHIGEQLCRSQNRSDFELLRRVYDHTTVVADGRIAYSHLSYKDITDAGCKADDIDDQVSIPRALKGVRLAMLFSEGEPGVVRINLRGEGTVTVVELAQRFGGGGHAQSAGVKMKNKPMEQVISEVVAAAEEHLRNLGVK